EGRGAGLGPVYLPAADALILGEGERTGGQALVFLLETPVAYHAEQPLGDGGVFLRQRGEGEGGEGEPQRQREIESHVLSPAPLCRILDCFASLRNPCGGSEAGDWSAAL